MKLLLAKSIPLLLFFIWNTHQNFSEPILPIRKNRDAGRCTQFKINYPGLIAP